MGFRRARDRILGLAIFFVFFLNVLSSKHEHMHKLHKGVKPQIEKQSSVDQTGPTKNDKTPKILDDPRLKGSKIYRPYPDYNSQKWQDSHLAPFTACLGPRNQPLDESLDDQVGIHVGIPDDFPHPIFGSHAAVGLDGKISFDRYTRYGPYGFGEEEESVTEWIKPAKVDWSQVKWGQLQKQCVQRNADRFTERSSTDTSSNIPHSSKVEKRTAILIRTYVGKEYSDNDIQVIRSLVTELSLQTGGEYEVVLLLHVKDDDAQIQQEKVSRKILEENVPREFWDMTVLWNTPMVAAYYAYLSSSAVDVHYAQWLCVQHYAREHPEFDYFWNWEIDTRFTGHHYEFVDQVAAFARKQPRRGLWERSSRFYIPDIHGDYDTSYREFVNRSEPQGIWGPVALGGKPLDIETSGASAPKQFSSEDDFEWGVGEEADFICLLPIFHPIGTKWIYQNEVFGYDLGQEIPRRACLITHSRFSRRLIAAMDEENLAGRHMGTELFPVSVALYHGLKAVSVPHPVYSEQPISPKEVDYTFNAGVNGRAGSSPSSVFSRGKELPFLDTSWYSRANLAGRLYWNFLGWEKGGTGGSKYELQYGRVRLPSILFHPVKDVRPDADSMGYKFDSELEVHDADEV